jgi:hypothetical protein
MAFAASGCAASTTPARRSTWGKYLAEEVPAIYGEQAAAVVVFVSAALLHSRPAVLGGRRADARVHLAGQQEPDDHQHGDARGQAARYLRARRQPDGLQADRLEPGGPGTIQSALITPDGRNVIVAASREVPSGGGRGTVVGQISEVETASGKLARVLRTQTARYTNLTHFVLDGSTEVFRSTRPAGTPSYRTCSSAGWTSAGRPRPVHLAARLPGRPRGFLGRLVTGRSYSPAAPVDPLAEEAGVAQVPRVLLDHVQVDQAQRHDLAVVGAGDRNRETITRRDSSMNANRRSVRLGDRPVSLPMARGAGRFGLGSGPAHRMVAAQLWWPCFSRYRWWYSSAR